MVFPRSKQLYARSRRADTKTSQEFLGPSTQLLTNYHDIIKSINMRGMVYATKLARSIDLIIKQNLSKSRRKTQQLSYYIAKIIREQTNAKYATYNESYLKIPISRCINPAEVTLNQSLSTGSLSQKILKFIIIIGKSSTQN